LASHGCISAAAQLATTTATQVNNAKATSTTAVVAAVVNIISDRYKKLISNSCPGKQQHNLEAPELLGALNHVGPYCRRFVGEKEVETLVASSRGDVEAVCVVNDQQCRGKEPHELVVVQLR